MGSESESGRVPEEHPALGQVTTYTYQGIASELERRRALSGIPSGAADRIATIPYYRVEAADEEVASNAPGGAQTAPAGERDA